MIEGRVVHKASNALRITFRSGPGNPLAVGVQGSGNGRCATLAILLGFRAAGAGRHRITYADGSVVWVDSRDDASTVLRRGDGTAIGHILRADTTTAVAATGGTVCHFVPHPDEPRTPDLFRLLVLDRMGNEIGYLDVIRTAGGWTRRHLAHNLWDACIWWDRAGRPLPVPILGTRLAMARPLDRVERDMLLGACVDIALGLRPYVTVMR
jgi:hypothetical protein